MTLPAACSDACSSSGQHEPCTDDPAGGRTTRQVALPCASKCARPGDARTHASCNARTGASKRACTCARRRSGWPTSQVTWPRASEHACCPIECARSCARKCAYPCASHPDRPRSRTDTRVRSSACHCASPSSSHRARSCTVSSNPSIGSRCMPFSATLIPCSIKVGLSLSSA